VLHQMIRLCTDDAKARTAFEFVPEGGCDDAVTVSLPAIEALWEAFNDLADGFGVALYEFKEIMAELTDELGLNRVKMDDRSTALFGIMDQDKVRNKINARASLYTLDKF
jgi:hypothetical protein